jgi:hypothetical protein
LQLIYSFLNFQTSRFSLASWWRNDYKTLSRQQFILFIIYYIILCYIYCTFDGIIQIACHRTM